jgi:hypothetical protein
VKTLAAPAALVAFLGLGLNHYQDVKGRAVLAGETQVEGRAVVARRGVRAFAQADVSTRFSLINSAPLLTAFSMRLFSPARLSSLAITALSVCGL